MQRGVRQTRRLLIGALLIVAIIAAWIIVFFLGGIVRSARDTYSIVGIFFETPRLRTGSPVWVAGHAVGVVTRIELLPPSGDSIPPFAATLQLPTYVRPEIRRDSRLQLRKPRPMSDPVVDLVPGSPASPVLQPGDTLRAQPPIRTEALIARGREVRREIDSLFTEGAMLRGQTQRPAALARSIAAELTSAHTEFLALAERIEAGPLPEFLADTTWRRSLERLAGLAMEIDSLAHARVAVLSDTLYRSALESLARQAGALQSEVAEIRAILNEPRGFPGRWERDPALRDALEATRAHLDALIEFTRRHPWRFFF